MYEVGSLLQLNIFFVILVHKTDCSCMLREPDQEECKTLTLE